MLIKIIKQIQTVGSFIFDYVLKQDDMKKNIIDKHMKDIYNNQLFQIQAAMFFVSLIAFAVSLLHTFAETEDKGLIELSQQAFDISYCWCSSLY